jgi:hypothetical protein
MNEVISTIFSFAIEISRLILALLTDEECDYWAVFNCR